MGANQSEGIPPPTPDEQRRSPRLLDQVRDAIRRRHYSYRTEQSYAHWNKRFIFFAHKRRPCELGAAEVTEFLNHLARDRDGKGGKDGVTMLPQSVIEPLKHHLVHALPRARRKGGRATGWRTR